MNTKHPNKSVDHSQMDHSEMDHSEMDHSQMDHNEMDHNEMDHSQTDHSAMDHNEMEHSQMDHSEMDHNQMDHNEMDHNEMDHNEMDHNEMDHNEMDHNEMDHSEMDHNEIDYSEMDHSQMDHSEMDHNEIDYSEMDHSQMDHNEMNHSEMDHSQMDHNEMDHSEMDHSQTDHSEMDHGAMGHAGHHEQMVVDYKKRFWVTLILTIPITVLSEMVMMLFNYEINFPGDRILLFLMSSLVFFYGGKPFLEGAWKELKVRTPGMMMLISLAIISAYIYSTLTTFFIQGAEFYFELTTLIVIMLLGHWIEMKSQMGASRALEELIKLMPKEAHKLDKAGNISEVSVEELVPGDHILIKSGEKIPLDGKIYEGKSIVDESMLTGESVPVEKKPGLDAIGGSINGSGVLKVEVEKTGGETYLAQVIEMVNEAQKQKSRSQSLADIAAKWLFYIALVIGIMTFIYWIFAADLQFALARMVTVFVIACPHALGLAVPLVNAVSTSIAARKGLLIRNRTQFEDARKIDWMVFDKTGTLTEGNFGVTDIIAVAGKTEDEILSLAYSVESQSEHPIAKGIVREGETRGVALRPISDYQNLTGEGLQAIVDKSEVAIVSPGSMKRRGLKYNHESFDHLAQQGKTVVFVLKDNVLQGVIAIADIIRASSFEVIQELKDRGIESVMMTGDNQRVANYVGEKLGLAKVFAEVLPDEKSKHIQTLKSDGSKVAMVGDGVNDAPALAAADLGIAIGAGTDVAIETADVILVNSDPKDVLDIITLSKASYRKMVENLIWAVGYNVIAIPLAAGILANQGFLVTPAMAAVVMSVSTVVCAVNARLLKID